MDIRSTIMISYYLFRQVHRRLAGMHYEKTTGNFFLKTNSLLISEKIFYEKYFFQFIFTSYNFLPYLIASLTMLIWFCLAPKFFPISSLSFDTPPSHPHPPLLSTIEYFTETHFIVFCNVYVRMKINKLSHRTNKIASIRAICFCFRCNF